MSDKQPRIAQLERDLAAAQTEVTACASQLERDRVTIGQQAQIIVDLKADLAAAQVTYTVRGLQCSTCGAWSDHRVSQDPRIAALEADLAEALKTIVDLGFGEAQLRIAALEGLLREAVADIYWANVVLKERIEAALGKEG